MPGRGGKPQRNSQTGKRAALLEADNRDVDDPKGRENRIGVNRVKWAE